MPGFQLLMEPKDVVYRYDGSLAGLYCCIHACVHGREMPLDIRPDAEEQMTLCPSRRIVTGLSRADRVREAVATKISPRARELLEHVFLSNLERKEMAMLRFVRLGFALGAGVTNRLADPAVDVMIRAEKRLLGEAHLLAGFLRFADYGGRLMAAISPRHFVLPLLAPHFADRYARETFLIYDRTHHAALVYEKGRAELVEPEGEWALPEVSREERFYQELWKRFYQTIGIAARENPRCRMTHMPKRYWENMVEMRPCLWEEPLERLPHSLYGEGGV